MMTAGKLAQAADGDFAARLADLQRDGRVKGLDALLVSLKGRTVFEYYGEGEAENWGVPLGKVTFGPTVLHDLRSVTKSIVSMLYGIALAERKMPPPEARLYDQFPEYADLAREPGRERITLADVLSMTMGLDWDELTTLPDRGAEYRGEQIAFLAGLRHDLETDARLHDWLAELDGSDLAADPGSAPAVNARVARRLYDRRLRVPRSLVQELALTVSVAQREWKLARRRNEFARFAPWL